MGTIQETANNQETKISDNLKIYASIYELNKFGVVGETTREIYFDITDFVTKKPSGYAAIVMEKNGKIFLPSHQKTVTEGDKTYRVLTVQGLVNDTSGKGKCQIVFVDENTQINDNSENEESFDIIPEKSIIIKSEIYNFVVTESLDSRANINDTNDWIDDVIEAASNAEKSATESKSYAVGGTGSRDGEDTDNSKYYKEQAGISADNAATSEQNAATSEQNASTSEENAATSATTATDQATLSKSYSVGGTNSRTGEDTDNAKYYKEQAKDSADSASTSEQNASISEQNAATSEGNAATSEQNASTSETNASESATLSESWAVGGTTSREGEDTNNSKYWSDQSALNKEGSETAKDAAEVAQGKAEDAQIAAETSETNAKTSETNAKTSETNAKTSETNASTSESNASTSETNARNSAEEANDALSTMQDSLDGVAQEYTGQSIIAQQQETNRILNNLESDSGNINGFSLSLGQNREVILGYTDPVSQEIYESATLPTETTAAAIAAERSEINRQLNIAAHSMEGDET